MNSCPRCNASIFPDDNFCGTCGYEINYDRNVPLVTKKDIKIADVRLKLGSVYLKMGRYDQAREIFEDILKSNPEDKMAQNMLSHLDDVQTDDSTRIIMKD